MPCESKPTNIGLKGVTLQENMGGTAAWAGAAKAKGAAVRANEAAASKAVLLTGIVALNMLVSCVGVRPGVLVATCAIAAPKAWDDL